MNYQGALDYLLEKLPMFQRTGKAAYKEGLENTYRLDEYFGHPHRKFKTIHVAGTNGKGSVCHMLASVLQASGYKTGLHTSPHLLDFRERMRINGKLMDEQLVVKFVEKHRDFFETLKPSFFEMSVFMSFDYFAHAGVDVAVVEVGMGGRLDSTNIILPEVSVITNIGLDHTEFLGDTLEKIAAEKAGIIKDTVPVVIGETNGATRPVFDAVARARNAPVWYAPENYRYEYSMLSTGNDQVINITNVVSGEKLQYSTDLLGLYQHKNLTTVRSAIDILNMKGFEIPESAIKQGLKEVKQSTGFRGRWDIYGYSPLVVCDTGHNAHGISEVIKQIRQTPWRKLHMVIGFVSDKDISSILTMLPLEAVYYFTRPSVPRGLDQGILAEMARAKGLKGDSYATVKDAVQSALSAATPNDMVFVGGSTFVVADYLSQEKK
ncbi:MAG: bifunctional folylpolyglutamate synthase/dihydrofolate synthase [Bacteroidales bacterium]|nr:bifunctional folylpolyglutamate synthase/dihydrofolate synthase [Bacteroidales bacterium]